VIQPPSLVQNAGSGSCKEFDALNREGPGFRMA